MKDVGEWREKYLTAVDQLEAQTSAWTKVDDVLRRLIKRLCIAARGFDAQFDAELAHVSGVVRSPVTAEVLESLLTRLTTAVAALDAARAAAPPRRQDLDAGMPAPSDSETLAEPLLLILDRLGVADAARADLDALRAGLAQPASGTAFANALWQLGDLVAAERQRLEREKAETERVLKQVTARLADFASFLAAADAEQGESELRGLELSQQLIGEVQEIGNTVRLATSLAELQSTVKSRLESIDAQLRALRAREAARASADRERAERMRARVVELEGVTAALEKSLAREQQLATRDALTGIANRFAYDERIAQEFKRYRRFRQPLTLVAWDLDRFKMLNDSYGHRAGDRVLHAFATVLREKVRETDFVARYGGEEFVMLLVGTGATAAHAVAETIRVEIGRLGFHFRGKPVSVTASCGIAEVRDGDTPESLFDRADRALYQAKDAGRDRCIVA